MKASAQTLETPHISALKPMSGPTGRRSALRALHAVRTDLLSYLRALDREFSGPEMTPVPFSLLGQSMYLITHPEQIKEMLSNHQTFTRNVKHLRAFRVALGQNIITVPDHEWPAVRKRTASYFSNEHLEHYGDVVVEVLKKHAVPRLSEKARAGEAVDLFDEMLGIASLAVFISFLGGTVEDYPREVYMALSDVFSYVRRNSFALLVLPRWVPTAENRELNRNLRVLREYLRPRLALDRDKDTMMGDIIRTYTDARGNVDGERVLDETIANLVGGSETTIVLMTYAVYYLVQNPRVEAKLCAELERVLDETIANLVGGSETTIVLMTYAVYYLVQNPRVEAKLCTEIERVLGTRAPSVQDLRTLPYLLQTIQETLRLRSPGYVNYRYVTADTELGGYRIAKGAWTVASQYITHQDPRVWKEPESFRPERFARESPEAPSNRKNEMPFFPFGGGIFFCIGKNYAINEAALMVAMLLQHFRFSAPDGGRRFADPGIDARLTLRPGSPIRMRVELKG